jgi:hypothetical protein
MKDFERVIEAGKTPLELWWSLIAGFLAWGVDLGSSYVLEQHSCSTGHYYLLHVFSIICLLLALSGFATGFAGLKRLPKETSEEAGSRFDRAYFQSLLGMAFSLSFVVVIIAGSLPRWILSPCD